MKPKSKSDPEVADWLRKADTDWRAAELVARAGLHDTVCFLCQQAAEKALKALLVAAGKAPPHVHHLLVLVRELCASRIDLGAIDAEAVFLTPFAVTARYPGFGENDEATATRALDACRRIRVAVEACLAAPPG